MEIYYKLKVSYTPDNPVFNENQFRGKGTYGIIHKTFILTAR